MDPTEKPVDKKSPEIPDELFDDFDCRPGPSTYKNPLPPPDYILKRLEEVEKAKAAEKK